MHPLSESWTLWAHLPQNSDWSIAGYIKIMTVTHVEELIALIHALHDKLISDCMLFLMKHDITPLWEDPQNKLGGCFSYKVIQKIPDVWKNISYSIAGNTLTKDLLFNKSINGISISPKKNFCILKLWMSTCKYKDPSIITIIKPDGCIFKAH
jgi:hypothetical protein